MSKEKELKDWVCFDRVKLDPIIMGSIAFWIVLILGASVSMKLETATALLVGFVIGRASIVWRWCRILCGY